MLHQRLGHAAAQVCHRRWRTLQHLKILHLQLAETSLARQSLCRCGQQRMG